MKTDGMPIDLFRKAVARLVKYCAILAGHVIAIPHLLFYRLGILALGRASAFEHASERISRIPEFPDYSVAMSGVPSIVLR